MLTALLRLCGHVSTVPSGVAGQSCSRMRPPISPPPARKSDPVARRAASVRRSLVRRPSVDRVLLRLPAIAAFPRGDAGSVLRHGLAGVSVLSGPEAMTAWPAVTGEASELDVFLATEAPPRDSEDAIGTRLPRPSLRSATAKPRCSSWERLAPRPTACRACRRSQQR